MTATIQRAIDTRAAPTVDDATATATASAVAGRLAGSARRFGRMRMRRGRVAVGRISVY